MPAIGIIDDRKRLRKVLTTALRTALTPEWTTIDADPLAELNEYPSWISANKVVSLIIDERLNETAVNSVGTVDYYGHDLVDFLRTRLKTLPIFVVTSYPQDQSLQDRFKDVEDIIDRTSFVKTPENYAARMVRSSQQYLLVFASELASLSDFALKIATGQDVSTEEKERAKAIQTKIETAFSIDGISNRGEWLKKMNESLDELEQLKSEIENLLKNEID